MRHILVIITSYDSLSPARHDWLNLYRLIIKWALRNKLQSKHFYQGKLCGADAAKCLSLCASLAMFILFHESVTSPTPPSSLCIFEQFGYTGSLLRHQQTCYWLPLSSMGNNELKITALLHCWNDTEYKYMFMSPKIKSMRQELKYMCNLWSILHVLSTPRKYQNWTFIKSFHFVSPTQFRHQPILSNAGIVSRKYS